MAKFCVTLTNKTIYMRLTYFILFGLMIGLNSCKSETSNQSENEEIVRLRNEVRQLKQDSEDKDLLIGESLSLFSEI